MAAFAFEIEDGIDHVLDDARTGDGAFLGDVANQYQRGAGLLGPAREFLCAGADLADGAGGGFEAVGPHGLDGIDDDEIRLGGL